MLLIGAALVGAATGAGCAPAPAFGPLATADRDLFDRCAPAIAAAVCEPGVAGARCLESRQAAYGRLHSARMRRSWLIATGCPEATVDAPLRSTPAMVAAVAPPSASPPAHPNVREPPRPPVSAEPPAGAEPTRVPDPPPPEVARGADSTPPIDITEVPDPESGGPPRPETAAVSPFSNSERGGTREQRLRDIIAAHRPEMKGCVDRQLKLLPALRAQGTLVIEVDASGSVPHAQLLGDELAGTPLETCLRTIASRWRFPSDGHGYRIDAPIRVWGAELGTRP